MTHTTQARIFKNINFVKRDYECTNIVAAEALNDDAVMDANWAQDDASILNGLRPLYVENDVRFYGYL